MLNSWSLIARAGKKLLLRSAAEAVAPYFFVHFTAPSFFGGLCEQMRKKSLLRLATQSTVSCKEKNSIFVVNMNFSKFITFQGIIQKILNGSAAHIWGPRHPPICLSDTFFSWQCPFTCQNWKSGSYLAVVVCTTLCSSFYYYDNRLWFATFCDP
jgi:hypothetical protein